MGKVKKLKKSTSTTLNQKPGLDKQKTEVAVKKISSDSKVMKKNASSGKISFEKTTSVKTTGSRVHKKDKLKQKRKTLLKKIHLIRRERKEEIKRKRREKAPLVGDLKALRDALPSLSELLKIDRSEIKLGAQEFGAQPTENLTKKARSKKRKEEFLKRYNDFEAVMKHPDYKKSPREAIAHHIRLTRNLED